MKQIIVFLIFAAITSAAYAQKNDSLQLLTIEKNQLLSKSKRQQTIGWIIFGTGLPVVLVTSYMLATTDEEDIDKPLFRKVLIASAAYTLVSIPLIIAGRRNKKKALSIDLVNNSIFFPGINSINYKTQPAISLTIGF